MATSSYIIYSHYDPKDRERLERETGQIPESPDEVKEAEVDSDEAWRIEASLANHKKSAPPPIFVPATFSYDDWGSTQSNSSTRIQEPNPLGNNLAGWYRSLNRSKKSAGRSAGNSEQSITRTGSVPLEVSPTVPVRSERTTKNNWFIKKAIQSEPPSTSSTPAPSLAEMLARDPPPLPTEKKFEPPVWLEIGPSNRGFAMLQRSGWNEGEPLGPNIVRRRKVEDIIAPDGDMITTLDKEGHRNGVSSRSTVRREIHEIKLEGDEVTELRNVDVIDLTFSDSDDEVEPIEEEDANVAVPKIEDDQSLLPLDRPDPEYLLVEHEDSGAHGRKALLTPIATILKSDRLGIGLKAKTTGPYKASQKRVTHNTAALAAHIRAGNEIRKQKREVGRGRRGFERQRKKEEANRQMMLAYLNS